MAALPNQGALTVPISWNGTPIKTTIQAGGYMLSGTIGLRPWRETALLSWTLPPTDAVALLGTLKAGKFNAVYDYDCNLFGPVKLRPTDSYSFQERRGTQYVIVTVAFERV